MTQEEIPGTERPKIPAIDESMERYVKIRDRRMSLTEQEVEARQHLEKLMLEHKQDVYRNSEGNMIATLKESEIKAKVKSVDSDGVSVD